MNAKQVVAILTTVVSFIGSAVEILDHKNSEK